jgi:hypothetical protein
MHKNFIYYLPGAGGELRKGLGQALLERGYSVIGCETVGAFNRLSFSHQVKTVTKDLLADFWTPDAKVIATSFGAYLFLHAQLEMEPFPGLVLLLSPVMGSATHPITGARFYRPRADVLAEAARTASFPTPKSIEVHVGDQDWQAGPDTLIEFCKAAGVTLHTAQGRGHTLGVDYVTDVLNRWL